MDVRDAAGRLWHASNQARGPRLACSLACSRADAQWSPAKTSPVESVIPARLVQRDGDSMDRSGRLSSLTAVAGTMQYLNEMVRSGVVGKIC